MTFSAAQMKQLKTLMESVFDDKFDAKFNEKIEPRFIALETKLDAVEKRITKRLDQHEKYLKIVIGEVAEIRKQTDPVFRG